MQRGELWMTVEKVSEETGLTAHAIRHMAERGQIPAHHFGRRLVFYRSELSQHMNDNIHQ